MGTESWWIDRNRLAGSSLAAATRLTRLRPRLALGHQQLRLGKAFGLQFLLDPLRQAQVENEFGDVAGADRAFRLGGMSDIDDDPEFRGSHVTGCRHGGMEAPAPALQLRRRLWRRPQASPDGGALWRRGRLGVAAALTICPALTSP